MHALYILQRSCTSISCRSSIASGKRCLVHSNCAHAPTIATTPVRYYKPRSLRRSVHVPIIVRHAEIEGMGDMGNMGHHRYHRYQLHWSHRYRLHRLHVPIPSLRNLVARSIDWKSASNHRDLKDPSISLLRALNFFSPFFLSLIHI